MTRTDSLKTIGIIPARAGSIRLENKNIKRLGDHPLIAYTISSALESKVFDSVIVSTDSELYADIARYYSAEVPFLRPVEFAGERSPDIEWVEYTLKQLQRKGRVYDCFSVLRPTSPFRRSETIRRAWQEFLSENGIDSLRAVEKCKQHPGKMWVVRGKRMTPLLPLNPSEQPWHSSQYQALPEVYVQNASLEIAWSRIVFDLHTIAGNVVMPFMTQGYEGFDINEPRDWWYAEYLLQHNKVELPHIAQIPYSFYKE